MITQQMLTNAPTEPLIQNCFAIQVNEEERRILENFRYWQSNVKKVKEFCPKV